MYAYVVITTWIQYACVSQSTGEKSGSNLICIVRN